MALHVEIKINDDQTETIHIGRTEPYMGAGVEHQYKVTTVEYPQTLYAGKPRVYTPNWEAGVRFGHVYSDGALVCVRKALEALEGAVGR